MTMRRVAQLSVSLHAVKDATGKETHISLIMAVDTEGFVWEFNGGKKSWDPLPDLPDARPNDPPVRLPAPGVVKS